MTMNISMTASGLEIYGEAITRERLRFDRENVVSRIWKRDPTVWKHEDMEISNRLGWLEAPAAALRSQAEKEAFASEIHAAGFTSALLCGMGGSSLAPEVLAGVFGQAGLGLSLEVLDSTAPGAVLRYTRTLPEGETLYIISSKSGTTLETASFMNYYYARARTRLGPKRAGESFIAVTDPGSFLESEARRLNFRRIFSGNPDIGGRFSVFSPFGLVPGALIRAPMRAVLTEANEAVGACRRQRAGENPGANLGIILGTLARSGRDKAVFLLSPALRGFGAWLEQLIAESTGKEDRGILPIVRTSAAPACGPSKDRVVIAIGLDGDKDLAAAVGDIRRGGDPVISMALDDPVELGAQFFLWEFATACAGAVLRINPFDQPNVALSKKKTAAALKAFKETKAFPPESPSWQDQKTAFFGERKEVNLRSGLRRHFDKLKEGGYAAIQAFLLPGPETVEALRTLAGCIETRTGRPVVFDFGPRFLHSTGQLHKGDGGGGVFLQLTAGRTEDAPVPVVADGDTSDFTFGNLIDAQALGDREALAEKGRPVGRLHIKGDPVEGIYRAVEQMF